MIQTYKHTNKSNTQGPMDLLVILTILILHDINYNHHESEI